MTREELRTLLDKNATAWAATGSRVICSPAPTDTDEDYIALMDDCSALSVAGFVMGTDLNKYEDMPDFLAFRCGDFNVVVTDSRDFYEKFVLATEQAKALNLLEKTDRIDLFQSILYGNHAQ